MKEELRRKLCLNHAYWINTLSREEIQSTGLLEKKDIVSARQYDVFATANFFNFIPWIASLELLSSIGLENVNHYNMSLGEKFISGLDREKYHLISPEEKSMRSHLVVVSSNNPACNLDIFKELKKRGFHTAFWKGNIRISPHVYNTQEQIDQLLQCLSNLNV